MFASWQPASTSDGRGVVLAPRPHTFDPTTAKTAKPVACHHCRAQKVRCIGEPSGSRCKRCQSLGKKCTYPPSSLGRPRAAKHVSGLESPGMGSEMFAAATLVSTVDNAPNGESLAEVGNGREDVPDSFLGSTFMDSWEDVLTIDYPSRFAMEQFSAGEESPNTPDSPRSLGPQSVGPLSKTSESTSTAGGHPHTQWYQETQGLDHEVGSLQGRPGRKQSQVGSEATWVNDVGPQCECLHRVVVLMDELDTLTEASGDARCHASVDGLLASHRDALRQAERMLYCASCTTRVENMTILALLASRLAALCRRAATELCSHPSGGPLGAAHAGVRVGTFRLESVAEFVAVMRTLLCLELRGLLTLVRRLQLVGKRVRSEAMGRRLDGCERSALGLLDGLGRECSTPSSVS